METYGWPKRISPLRSQRLHFEYISFMSRLAGNLEVEIQETRSQSVIANMKILS